MKYPSQNHPITLAVIPALWSPIKMYIIRVCNIKLLLTRLLSDWQLKDLVLS